MSSKTLTTLIIAPPQDSVTGGTIVSLTGHYLWPDPSINRAEMTSFDIDMAKKVNGTGPVCFRQAKDLCDDIEITPDKTFVVLNGWLSATDWVAHNKERVSGYYHITSGDTLPVKDFITRVGFRYLIDYLSGMISPQKAGKTRLSDDDMKTLKAAFLSAQRNVQKDINELGQTMTNMRFEDLLISAMTIGLIYLKETSPRRSKARHRTVYSASSWMSC